MKAINFALGHQCLNFLFTFIISSPAISQTYIPFPTNSDYIWREFQVVYNDETMFFPWQSHIEFIVSGDTVIAEKNYRKLFSYNPDNNTGTNYEGAIREESKKIYFLTDYMPEGEVLLYDFNLNTGDLAPYGFFGNVKVLSTDSILIGNSFRKSYQLANDALIVEGIGDITNGLIQSVYQIPTCLCYHSWNYHTAFLLKDEILYNNPRFVNGRLADYFGLTIFDSHLGNHLKWSVLKNNEFAHSEEWISTGDTVIKVQNKSQQYIKIAMVDRPAYPFNNNVTNAVYHWKTNNDIYQQTKVPVYIRSEYSAAMHEKIYMYNSQTQTEYLISDMNLQVGDTFYLPPHHAGIYTQAQANYAIADSIYYRYNLKHIQTNALLSVNNQKLCFIEGIGPNTGLQYAWEDYSLEMGYELNCFNSEYVFYKNNENPLPCNCNLTDQNPYTKNTHEYLLQNPVQDILLLRNTEIRGLAAIFDMKGRMYFSGTLQPEGIDVRHLEPGIYLLKIKTNDERVLNVKFIKQ